MSSPDKDIIQEKLSALQTYYRELKELQDLTYEEYCSNYLYKRTAERLLQLIVEAATDINNMVLKVTGKETPTDYFSSFIKVAECAIFPMDFALEIAPSTGMRNIIVHEYQEVDDRLIHAAIRDTLTYYLQYMEYMEEYLNNNFPNH